MDSQSSLPAPPGLLRISQIGGHYLVFDAECLIVLRRVHGICGTLTGTAPQHPNQNLFFSLPLEMGADEVSALVGAGKAYVCDEAAAHVNLLSAVDRDPAARSRFVDVARQRKAVAQKFLSEARQKKPSQQRDHDGITVSPPAAVGNDEDVSASPSTLAAPKELGQAKSVVSVTSASSQDLFGIVDDVPSAPAKSFVHHLHSLGYFTTPGLRFGAQYSVYPGDPLRFHAHFLANRYDWDEQVPLLDLVGTGRLATGVKKGFLFGACEREHVEETTVVGAGDSSSGYRMFCIEWAGM